MPTTISELTGKPVDTSSAAWRHECECAWILDNKPTPAEKYIYLYGVADRLALFEADQVTIAEAHRKPTKMSIYKVRGLKAAEQLLADMKKLHAIRAGKKEINA